MKITYDPAIDVLRILLAAGRIHQSEEAGPGVIVDFDADGNAVGFEVLDASRRVDNARAVEYAVAGV
jgi:uncharacterized protein YuzE